ncbi:GMC family oxidoreductase [Nocardioides gansuensis]|uniref:GMC family oxidoreductase n=1 Tax=Nocardioides gansuensis TaxID=2138300 RepID=A0A2T8F7H9_9ACTN|nr:GMC family oxidoreductase [Nocardioides gansuensis]
MDTQTSAQQAAREHHDDDHYDVVIVGAGPSGAVTAKRLVEAGFRVAVVEQGDWPDYSKARANFPDYELTLDRHWPWNPNRDVEGHGFEFDDSASTLTPLMWNGVGGSALVWAAQWQRNLPSDFRVRTLDGVADDWQLTYEDLEPFYVRVERDFGVSGLAGDPMFPAGDGPPMPPVPIREHGRRIAKAHNELGWHWWPGTNAIASRHYEHANLKACTQRAACMRGCPERAKSSPDITHWPQSLAKGVTLILRAQVRRVLMSSQGLAEGVMYTDEHGVDRSVRGDVVVLAANGIGTPRLLLLSADARHPDGLANGSGQVGRRLMMHPLGQVIGVWDDPVGTTHGVHGQQLHSLEFYETDESRGFVRGAKWGLLPSSGPLTQTRSYPWGSENAIWGPGFQDALRGRLGHSAWWAIICEDLPEDHNRVSLHTEKRDRFGDPLASIEYKTSDNSDRMLEFHLDRAVESMQAAGARQAIRGSWIKESAFHHLGTAVMGADPATSVVDGWGRAHEVPNLFIFDGSVWPTSAGMNPTATIAALALRNTEAMIAARSGQVTAS